jgi:galactose mutarotase-like enzyme
MAQHLQILLDADEGVPWKVINLHAGNTLRLAANNSWQIKSSLGAGGVATGVQLVELCNGPLAFTLIPSRGMGIWKGDYRGLPLGWKSPNSRPVHPSYVNLAERNGLGWLNGFNELLCRCGLASQGPPGDDGGEKLTLHGRIANLPATQVEAAIISNGPGALEVRGTVEEATFFGHCYRLDTTFHLGLGENRARLTDVITNLGARPAPLSLLYHINLGQPFLEEGATVTVPSRDVVPRDARSGARSADWYRYDGPQPGFAEEGFFFNPLPDADGWCTAFLANREASAAFAVRFRTDTLPWFTVWKNTMALEEGYVTGIEPGVNLPNFRAYEREQGRVPVLGPGESYECALELVVEDSAEGVARLVEAAANCQGSVLQKVHATPQPGWTPAGDSP